MTNPYHDPYSGQFIKRGEMNSLMSKALSGGEFEKYSTYRTIIEKADKEKDARIMEGFQAVKTNDAAKLQELVGSKLTEIADSSEERDILSGWSHNASPEALDALVKNPNFSHQALEAAFNNLSEEDKLKFLRENKNLEKSKLGFMVNSLVGTQYKTHGTYARGRAAALLERETVSYKILDDAKRVLGSAGVMAKLRTDYDNGSRTVWPFSASSHKQEMSLLNDSGRSVGHHSRIFFAKNATNPVTLAAIGASDPIAVDSVLENPHTDTKALTTILARNDFLTSAQYLRIKARLEADPSLPEKIATSLKSDLPSTPSYSVTEADDLQRELKVSARKLVYANKSLTAANSRELATAAKVNKANEQKTFDTARAKLDSTEQNYNSLLKQERYLTAQKGTPAHQRVLDRIANANKYRNQKGGIDAIRKSLQGYKYDVTLLSNSFWG